MNGQFKKTMKVQARKGLLLMLCFLLLPVVSLIAPGGVAQAGPVPGPSVTSMYTNGQTMVNDIVMHKGYLYITEGQPNTISRISIEEDGSVSAGAEKEVVIEGLLEEVMSVAFDRQDNLYYTLNSGGLYKVDAGLLTLEEGPIISDGNEAYGEMILGKEKVYYGLSFNSIGDLYFTSFAGEPFRYELFQLTQEALRTNQEPEVIAESLFSLGENLAFDSQDNLYFVNVNPNASADKNKLYRIEYADLADKSIDMDEQQPVYEYEIHTVFGLYIHNHLLYYTAGNEVFRIEDLDLSPREPWEAVTTGTTEDLHKLIYAGDTYVAVGDQSAVVHARDGKTWQASTATAGGATPYSLWAVVYQDDTYYAAGEQGSIFHSTNLQDWHELDVEWIEGAHPTDHLYDAAASEGGGFLIVGAHETMVAYDEEWINLTQPGGTAVLRSYDNAGAVQVAVGENRTLWYLEAPDDDRTGEDDPVDPTWQSWTPQGPAAYHLYGVASHDEAYVAVGEEGVIFTSGDGIAWQQQDSGTEADLRNVRYIHDRFYAVGDQGTLISSEDGVQWTKHKLAGDPSFDFYDIARGPSGTVIVGSGGHAILLPLVRVERVEVTPATLTLTENGDTGELTATVLPETAANKAVTWSSSDVTVATVEDGIVTPLKEGMVTITATPEDGGQPGTAVVTVRSSYIDVESVQLAPKTLTLEVDETRQLTATVLPADANNRSLGWVSSAPGIVSVDQEGNLTALATGSATITAASIDNPLEFDTAIITVVRSVTGVTLSPQHETLIARGPNFNLTAEVLPADASNTELQWSSDEPHIASVDNGVVRPLRPGTAVITVTTVDGGYTATATIAVVRLVSGIVLDESSFSLDEGLTRQLTATVAPEDASQPAVTWTSSNNDIATVTEGLVSAVKKGTAVITATSADGKQSASATVNVIRRATDMTVSPETLTLYENGKTETLIASVLPEDANDRRVTWSSEDTSIATVSAAGVVQPHAIGQTKITVKSVDREHIEREVNVIVLPNRANDVTLDTYALTMQQGDAPVQLRATVWPSNASDKRVTWESNRPEVAAVVDGLVTPVSGGTADITVRTVDGGYSRQTKVTVVQTIWPVTGVKLDKPTLELTVGGANGQLTAAVAPANATNKAVQWSSSKPEVAAVNSNGVITAVSAGTTVITVTTVDGGHTAAATVTVKAAAPQQPPGGGTGGGGGFGGGGVAAPPAANPTEEISAPADGGTGSENLAAFTIKRTAGGGTKQDVVALEAAKTKEAADKAKAAGLSIIRVLIPDARDEVSETAVTLPAGALESLRGSELGLELSTVNARLIIGSETLAAQQEELYFRLKPLKTAGEQTQLENRAGAQQVVQAAVGAGTFEVVGRPVTIETNMKGHRVEIILPLAPELLPAGLAAREAWLSRLMIFIEHSDGERVLAQPQVVTDPAGRLGLSFEVTKFSTFSILEIEAAEVPATGAEGDHGAYMNGYEDGSFRPSREVTRAELAAILSRLYPMAATESSASEPTDIATHWAAASIRAVVAAGYMQGYPEGSFQPDRVLSRAEIAAILSRIEGLTHTGTATFGDVASGHWAEGYIAAVAQAGLMTGYDGKLFKPGQGVTRAETVVIFNRLLGREPLIDGSEPSWADVSPQHWAFGDIEEASRARTS
ncbi:Ig-like domain-containing protein [Paenibacillus sp. 1P07SE]|uniref:Ig-like domain-containing protein n=1 Tax=Paenibacillus sp. 1P07SE TaxID=3132209 RepID=UPI0039A4993D